MSSNTGELACVSSTIAYLRSTAAIRDRAAELFALGMAGKLAYFQVDLDRLDLAVAQVKQVTQQAYPDLAIPLHSRWRHFPSVQLHGLFAGLSDQARAKAQIDLVIPSVLLDAGAGADWRYVDQNGTVWHRSQGLAVASLEMFAQGLFSQRGQAETDGFGLKQLTLAQLSDAFQVSAANPLIGLEGRLNLLHRLGNLLLEQPHLFGAAARLGNLLDGWLAAAQSAQTLSAETILETILTRFSDVWPSRETFGGVNLGDVWMHPQLSPLLDNAPSTYIPFHKLSQWLTYSLLEPIQALGITVINIDRLTGLAEYRNGGLFLDLGVLQLRDPTLAQRPHPPDATVIVEWRGLTIHLLQLLADRLRQCWQMDATQLPLAQVLQGGTWQAGRTIAAQRRRTGEPPLRLFSDGTVF